VEAAQHAATGGGPLRAAYERIAKRRGKQVAKVAVARKILTLCFYGLRDGEIVAWHPGQGAHDQNDGGHPMTRRANAVAAGPAVNGGSSSELVCCQWPLPADQATDGRPLD
jgi:hypothetical protein